MAKEIVKYNNKMNKIPLKKFEKIDLNFFYAICSQVKEKGSELVEIPLDRIKELTDYKSTSVERFKSDLIRMNEKLRECHGIYETEDEIVQFNLFSTFTIIKSRQVLKIRVNPDVAWLLNDIAKEFTSFELQEYVSLDGIYSKALYRLLKQWRRNGKTPKYGIGELKELLGTPNYETRRLMEKIINPAVEEIKQKKAFSTLWCEVIYAKKRGKPVDGYIFHFGKDEIEGQMSIETLEGGKYMPSSQTGKPAKRKAKTVNKFNNFPQRKYSDRYYELFEKMNTLGLTDEEQEEIMLESKKATAR